MNWDDREAVLRKVRRDGDTLCRASGRLKIDRDLVLEAVKQSGMALFCCGSDELKDDADVVFAAVENNYDAIQFASTRLKGDKTFVYSILPLVGHLLSFVDEKFREDHPLQFSLRCRRTMALWAGPPRI